MTNEEFDAFEPANKTQSIAYARIITACGIDEHALRATKEITDRTEGRPQQSIDMSVEQDNTEHTIKGFVLPTVPEGFVDRDIVEQAGIGYLK